MIRRVLLIALPAALLAPAPAAARPALAVVPFPGTPDASPQTQVIFSSLPPGQLRSVSVTGSRSGLEPGRVTGLPDGAGTAFVPVHSLRPGEWVLVRALLRSGARIAFSFTVARPVAPVATEAEDTSVRAPLRRAGPPTQHFRSAPGLHPPAVTATVDRDTKSGDIFLTPNGAPQVGPLVLDSQGRVVWFDPLTPTQAADLSVQRYHGRPVLTWWQGVVGSHAEEVIVNRHYRTIAAVRAGNGYVADPHEFQITPQGTALIDAYVPLTANLTSVGGTRDEVVLDNVVQEIDIPTGKVLWEWHTLGHIPLRATYLGPPDPTGFYDPYHLNSIEQLPSGNLLLSFRNTWAVYEISRRTGKVIWSLGGKDSSFKMGAGTNFEWQHDARMHPGGRLSLFDDGALPQEERQSSAKILRINTRTKTATLLHRYTHKPPVLASVAGNTQILPNHNVFDGWGSQGEFTESTPSGRQIFAGSLPLGVEIYRASRFPWVGQPLTQPSLALTRTRGGAIKLYVSWNGATQVAAWRFLGGSAHGHLHQLGATAPRTGFETAVRRRGDARFFAVQALNSHGRVVATSRVRRGF